MEKEKIILRGHGQIVGFEMSDTMDYEVSDVRKDPDYCCAATGGVHNWHGERCTNCRAFRQIHKADEPKLYCLEAA